MSKSNFNKDKVLAKIFETEVFNLWTGKLNNNLKIGFIHNDTFAHPEYDVKIIDKFNNYLTFEVKAQKIYKPNDDYFFIEYEQGGRPSGINASEADAYYIFKYNADKKDELIDTYKKDKIILNMSYELYIINNQDIKDIINDEKDQIQFSSFGDQKGGSKGWKIPIRLFDATPINFELNNNDFEKIKNNKINYKNIRELRTKLFYVGDKYIEQFNKTPPNPKTILGKGHNSDSDSCSSDSDYSTSSKLCLFKNLV